MITPHPGSTSGGSRGSRVEAYKQKAFSMHTSAARNWVRSQKTQSVSVTSRGSAELVEALRDPRPELVRAAERRTVRVGPRKHLVRSGAGSQTGIEIHQGR